MNHLQEAPAPPKWLSYPVREGVGEFYKLFDEVRRVALKTLKKRKCEDAEDLAQDVVIDALEHVEADPQYFETRSIGGWATQAALYALHMWTEKRDASEALDSRFDVERATEYQERNDPHQMVERSELRLRIDYALAVLPPKHRAVVVAVYMEGATYKEASQQLGFSVATIGTYLHSAREVLKRVLDTPITDPTEPDDEAEL